MSKNVVCAGAGAVCKHVLDQLLESKAFNVTVFTRSPKPALEERGAVVKVVDYNSVASLRQALGEGQPDTILDFIVSFEDPEGEARAHDNLLEASLSFPSQDGGTGKIKRFVPPEYVNDIARFPSTLTIEANKGRFRSHLASVSQREGIETTHVCIGIFMDFFLPSGSKKYFPDLPSPIMGGGEDGGQMYATVCGVAPEDAGQGRGDKISLTMGDDVGRAMVRLLQVPLGGWDKYTFLSGDRVTWEEAFDIVDRVTGGKISRTYLPLEELKRQVAEAKKDPWAEAGMKLMWAELQEAFGNGSETLPETAKVLHDLKCVSWEEMVKEYYV